MVRRGSTVRVRQRALQKPRTRAFCFRIDLQILERWPGMEPFMEPSGPGCLRKAAFFRRTESDSPATGPSQVHSGAGFGHISPTASRIASPRFGGWNGRELRPPTFDPRAARADVRTYSGSLTRYTRSKPPHRACPPKAAVTRLTSGLLLVELETGRDLSHGLLVLALGLSLALGTRTFLPLVGRDVGVYFGEHMPERFDVVPL
jgi:hypothetical protein